MTGNKVRETEQETARTVRAVTRLHQFPEGLRVAVIGASGGIGRALVSLLSEDERVGELIALSRSGSTEPHERVRGAALDLSDEASI